MAIKKECVIMLQKKIKFRRKNGIGFVTFNKPKTLGISIIHECKTYTINEYFSQVIEAYRMKMHVLHTLLCQINESIQIKLSGSGICAQIRMIEGCAAKALLEVLKMEKCSPDVKELITQHYDMLKTLIKTDLRIVERKKAGHKKARKSKPSNKR